mgnify:FL=1
MTDTDIIKDCGELNRIRVGAPQLGQFNDSARLRERDYAAIIEFSSSALRLHSEAPMTRVITVIPSELE